MQIACAYAFTPEIPSWMCNYATRVSIYVKLLIHAGRQWVKLLTTGSFLTEYPT